MTQHSLYRLPDDITPCKYDLKLTPNFNLFTFKGSVSIDINVRASTNRITLNSADLSISSVRLVTEIGSSIPTTNIDFDREAETVSFLFSQEIPAGRSVLHIGFSGDLNDQLRGFYRCKYVGLDGEDKYLGATQFEATDARRAFPCWDEPAAKASFEVTLEIPSAMVAISNTTVVEETIVDSYTKLVRFYETPKMSTYLLAFIVGELGAVSRRTSNGTLVSVWTTPGKETQGQFALETAAKLLEYFNSYFGIPYPLEKLDHIALPDFAAGAMENWGAITYREIALLFDPENSAANTRQRIAEIVSHEMAHMWFGDLVTMEWWDDLWLNESFASWMGNKAVADLYPEWDMWTQFVYQDTNGGLNLDALQHSHPIEVEVSNPAEIGELFDAISYNKGGAVLRMLEGFLGEDIFRQGIHHYLKKNQYGNARTEDLWKSLEQVSGKPVTEIMNTWIKQAGYPFIQVETSTHNTGVIISLSQQRFLYDLLMPDSVNTPAFWQVPITVSSRDTKASALMGKDSLKISLTAPTNHSSAKWVKVNSGQTGFYRVNYAESEWNELGKAVCALELPATDRLGLQNDAFALMRAGIISPTLFLDLIDNYRNEIHTSVWSDLASNLASFDNLISSQPYHDKFQLFAQTVFQKAALRVGWCKQEGEGHLDSLLRTTILGQIGSYGHASTLEEATSRFHNYLSNSHSINPDIRDIVFNLTAQAGDEEVYKTLLDLETQTELQEEKLRILRATTRFRRRDLLQQTLDLSLSPRVRSQDTVSLVMGVASNPYGRELAWSFIKENWSEFTRRYGGGGFAIMRLVSIIGGFTTLDYARDIEGFFDQNPTPSANRTIQQSLERIHLNAKWLDINGQTLSQWFSCR